jgi:hypothetical protein
MRALRRTFHGTELPSERHALEDQFLVSAARQRQRPEQQGEHFHRALWRPARVKTNLPKADGVMAKDSVRRGGGARLEIDSARAC